MIKEAKSSLGRTKDFLFSKRGLVFFLLLIPINTIMAVKLSNLLSLIFIQQLGNIALKSGTFPISLFYILLPVSIVLFALNIVVMGGIISSVDSMIKDEKELIKSLKSGAKNVKNLLLVGLIIAALNFLVLLPPLYMEAQTLGKEMESPRGGSGRMMKSFKAGKLDSEFVYGAAFLSSLSRVKKPMLTTRDKVMDVCVLKGVECATYTFSSPSLLFNIPLLLISLLFLWVFQEIMLGKSTISGSIGQSLSYFRNRFEDVAAVWIISSFLYLGISLIFFLPSFTGLTFLSSVSIYLGQVLAFLVIIAFQTSYYPNLKERT